MVYIEDAIYIQNFKTSQAIAESIGNVKLLCKLNKIPFKMVPITSWKKEVVGKGNAKKEDVKDYVVKTFEISSDCKQDIYDAYCIGLYGVRFQENANN